MYKDVEDRPTILAKDIFPISAQLQPATVLRTSEQCTGCGSCRKDCHFLQEYGLPGDIAKDYGNDPDKGRAAAFACSLCGHCTAVCPAGINPVEMFLDLRREAFLDGSRQIAEHSRVLKYEKKGTSKRYTWYSLPHDCDIVFFPGCTLSGTRPKATNRIYELLQAKDATTGIVLDCCSKPSHDLGRQQHFEAMFFELCKYLREAGVKKVIVACPNCYNVFSRYGKELQVAMIYEYLAEDEFIGKEKLSGTVTVHDPCVFRTASGMHQIIRSIIRSNGLTIREMDHAGERTICCGEGGAVGCIVKNLPRQWGLLRRQEANGEPIITYCAGCAGKLNKFTPTFHLLDLFLEPERMLAGKVSVSRAPFTYLNRLRLKKQLQQKSKGARTRERTSTVMSAENSKRPGFDFFFRRKK